MKVRDKIEMDREGLTKNGPITIVAFGDSVTHGCLDFEEIDYETVYWNRLKQMLNRYRNFVPVNVIDAGIGGITAAQSLERMDSQVLDHHPDLVIISFGLNDVNGPLEVYLDALGQMFDRCRERNIDAIFMTPNMLNTYVTEAAEGSRFGEYAHKTAEMQNSGKMDRYMESACRLAREKQVTVCDCYAKWKALAKTEDTTRLLANGINHPIREMHQLFAEALYRCIFPDQRESSRQCTSETMFRAPEENQQDGRKAQ